MTKSRLFGYSVDEEEGKLIITIDGALAESGIRQLRESSQVGRAGEMLAELLPLRSLYKLMSTEQGGEAQSLTLEQLLGQNIDQGLGSFEQQLAELRESIGGLTKGKGGD